MSKGHIAVILNKVDCCESVLIGGVSCKILTFLLKEEKVHVLITEVIRTAVVRQLRFLAPYFF